MGSLEVNTYDGMNEKGKAEEDYAKAKELDFQEK